MKILLAGATGFIGSKTIIKLLKGNHSLSIIQSNEKKNSFDNHISEKKIFNILTDTDYDNKLKNLPIKDFDCLLYFFWANLPNYNSYEIHNKNYLVSKNLIDYLFKKGLKKIYTIGTCYEYLGYTGKVNEDLKINTKLPYPFFKNKLREYLDKKYNKTKIKSSWIRMFYVYSRDQRKTSLIPQLHSNKNKVFTINSGNQIIDIYHANIHINIIVKIIVSKKSFKIINCCSGKPIQLKRFVLNYLKRNKLNINVKFNNKNSRSYETDFWGSTTLLERILKN